MPAKQGGPHQATMLCVVETHPLAYRYITEILQKDPTLSILPWGKLQQNPEGGPSPQVFVLDMALLPQPLSHFLHMLRSNFSASKYIVLSGNASESEIVKLLFLGAHGFLTYDEVPGALSTAVKAVAGGNVWVPQQVLQQYINVSSRMFDTGTTWGGAITKREREILELLVRRLSNKEISQALGISESTVKFHLGHIFAKFQVSDRASLQEVVQQQRLLDRSLLLGTSRA